MRRWRKTHTHTSCTKIITAAQLAAAGAARRAAVAGTTNTNTSFNPEGEEVLQAQLLPPQDQAVAALLERARAMAAQAVAEIFRGLRLEDGVGEEMEVSLSCGVCVW